MGRAHQSRTGRRRTPQLREPAATWVTTKSTSGLRAAKGMFIPFDEDLGIHPQDSHFLEREVWDLRITPATAKRPLLLHYHPLVIYRFQVLKQADVVLALFLQGQRFTPEEEAPELRVLRPDHHGRLDAVGRRPVDHRRRGGLRRPRAALLHSGAVRRPGRPARATRRDGVHVASTGGIWNALVFGFGGMRDHGGKITFDPRLPASWQAPDLPRHAARNAGPRRSDGRPGYVHGRERHSGSVLRARVEPVLLTAAEPVTHCPC